MYANNIYLDEGAPLYGNGSRTLAIINCMCLALFVLTKLYYVLRNRYRDRVWAAMSPEVRIFYFLHGQEQMGQEGRSDGM
jgi:hypothetical protein